MTHITHGVLDASVDLTYTVGLAKETLPTREKGTHYGNHALY